MRLLHASAASRFTEPRRRARRYMVAGGGAATAAQPPVSRKNKQNPAVWRGGIMRGFNLLRCFIPPSARVSPCTRLFCHRRFQRGSLNHVSLTEVSLGKLAPPPPKSLIALTGSEIFACQYIERLPPRSFTLRPAGARFHRTQVRFH